MKKVFVILALVSATFLSVKAQDISRAIGLRFGYGAEVTYQHPLSNANRLELDLGISNWGSSLNGVYQWVKDLSALSDGFNWYYGVGASLGLRKEKSDFGLGILGQIGIEYNFNIPLQISLDYRPGLYFIPTPVYGTYDGICLSFRYRF